jgi:hypothetical protein
MKSRTMRSEVYVARTGDEKCVQNLVDGPAFQITNFFASSLYQFSCLDTRSQEKYLA